MVVVGLKIQYNEIHKDKVCQAALRHMNHPIQILQIMKDSVKKNGWVVIGPICDRSKGSKGSKGSTR